MQDITIHLSANNLLQRKHWNVALRFKRCTSELDFENGSQTFDCYKSILLCACPWACDNYQPTEGIATHTPSSFFLVALHAYRFSALN